MWSSGQAVGKIQPVHGPVTRNLGPTGTEPPSPGTPPSYFWSGRKNSLVPSLRFPLRPVRPGPEASSSYRRFGGRGPGLGPVLPASGCRFAFRPPSEGKRGPACKREAGNTGRSLGPGRAGALPADRGGTLGRNRWCGCGKLIHCRSAALPPSSVPPSSSPLGIHLSPPGPASPNDL